MKSADKKTLMMLLFFTVSILFAACLYAREAAEDLAQVEKLFMEAKYDRVVTDAGKLIDTGAHGREELCYLKGLSLMQLSRFSEARQTFDYMVGRYPKGKRAFDGYTGIGDAYFLEGKYNEAVVAYNDALKTFPDHKNSGVIYYKMGSAYQKLRINDKASDYYRKARQISPMSFESNMAPKELPSTPRIIIFEDQPKSVATPGVADSGSGYYYVQAGYFRTKANAEKLNNKLKQKGYESSIAVQMKLGMDFYRVKVGHFKTKAEAEEVSKRMRKEGYLTKVCR